METKLTERQRRFIDEYIKTVNASDAARKAGYSAKNANVDGSKLLANSNISREIEKRLDELRTARTADLRECLEFVTSTMRGEITEQTPIQILDGRKARFEIVETPAKIRDRLKACEYLLKVNRAFDKVDESKQVPDVIKIVRFQGNRESE